MKDILIEIMQGNVTPIRRQYLRVKQRYPQAIVFFRLGDFYETFDDDAKLASRALEITLTSREMGKGQRVPMAGIPYHALDGYLAKLINNGYKVAICEQVSRPGVSKGLVQRDVIRVVTPGTVIEPSLLEIKTNNYLASVIINGDEAGLAYVDITTSEFATTQLKSSDVFAELERLHPSEILAPASSEFPDSLLPATVTCLDGYWFDLETACQTLLDHFGVTTMEGYGCANLPLAIRAAGSIVHYLQETQKASLGQLSLLSTYFTRSFMTLDAQTARNLELFQGGRFGASANSLLSVIDLTKTAMGGRLLKRWLGQPLVDITELKKRQDVVAWFHADTIGRGKVVSLLSRVADMERLVNRVRGEIASPKEVVTLRRSLEVVPEFMAILENAGSLNWLVAQLKPCQDIVELVSRAIVDEPPAGLDD